MSRSLRSYYYDFNVGMAVVSWAPAVYLLYVVLVDFSRLLGRWVPSYASPPRASSTAEIQV